ncbi:MAG: (2Fe-2S)-binding protein [Rhodothermales bacterium]|nr:(2Fe-2S)-binding protein [Rhodothermales bacterium]MBO6779246.1 (2Fe-2S)-binding protein [Rhodothermales bacterium]
MPTYTLTVNGELHTVEAEADMPLLWVLRDILGLTGTKFGCGSAYCGACEVHVDGSAQRSCVAAIAGVAGSEITTIEGLSPDGSHPLQLAWNELNVPQCGYCQSGQLMRAAAWMQDTPNPTPDDVDRNQSGNLCRCGTYKRIKAAILLAAEKGA